MGKYSNSIYLCLKYSLAQYRYIFVHICNNRWSLSLCRTKPNAVSSKHILPFGFAEQHCDNAIVYYWIQDKHDYDCFQCVLLADKLLLLGTKYLFRHQIKFHNARPTKNDVVQTNTSASREAAELYHSEQYWFFRRSPWVLLPCNPKRTLGGFSWGCMVIVLKGSFWITYIFQSDTGIVL